MLLALLACTGPDPKPPEDTGPTDADGDGVYTPDDCHDDDANAYPGAPEDPNGDGVDGDCDGTDGVPFTGCTPIDVPDTYATIEDALAAGDLNICLGAGTFTPGPLPEGARSPTGFRGQGRDQTLLVDPGAQYAVGVLNGLTVTGTVTAYGSLSFSDVTVEDAPLAEFDNFVCDRCALVRSPLTLSVEERIAGIVMTDTWVTGSEAAVTVVTEGCQDTSTCNGDYVDVRLNHMTFTGNTTAFAFDLTGNYQVYLVLANSIFAENDAVLTVDIARGGTQPQVYTSGSDTIAYSGEDERELFPDGYDLRARDQDPLLDMAFAPPRPLEDSPAVDSAGDGATTTDFWGLPRETADKEAVER